jgi:hypothetical protein
MVTDTSCSAMTLFLPQAVSKDHSLHPCIRYPQPGTVTKLLHPASLSPSPASCALKTTRILPEQSKLVAVPWPRDTRLTQLRSRPPPVSRFYICPPPQRAGAGERQRLMRLCTISSAPRYMAIIASYDTMQVTGQVPGSHLARV